jgi:hypothetical protein
MSHVGRTRGGTQITPIWRCTGSTGETIGAAPNGGYGRLRARSRHRVLELTG